MITINRTSYIEEKREIIKTALSTAPKNYKTMVDLRNGNIILVERSKAKYYIQIGQLRLSSVAYTNKNISALASELTAQIKSYNKVSLICKSHVKSEYGSKGLLDAAFVMTVDNQHYKCAGAMNLYDKNVIDYYLQKA